MEVGKNSSNGPQLLFHNFFFFNLKKRAINRLMIDEDSHGENLKKAKWKFKKFVLDFFFIAKSLKNKNKYFILKK